MEKLLKKLIHNFILTLVVSSEIGSPRSRALIEVLEYVDSVDPTNPKTWKDTIKDNSKLGDLLKLIRENPGLRVIPLVETEVVASDDFNRWIAEIGDSEVKEYCLYDEMYHDSQVFVYRNDTRQLTEWLYENLDFGDITDSEKDIRVNKEIERQEWGKAIFFKIVHRRMEVVK